MSYLHTLMVTFAGAARPALTFHHLASAQGYLVSYQLAVPSCIGLVVVGSSKLVSNGDVDSVVTMCHNGFGQSKALGGRNG